MNIKIIGRIIGTSALGLIMILMSSQLIDAQGKNERKERQKIEKQQRKEWKNRSKMEDRRIRSDQRTESARLRNLPYRAPNSDGDRWRANRNGTYYNTNDRGVQMLRQAVRAGYQEGYREGRDDRNYRRSNSFQSSGVYRRGNFGYRNYVSAGEYRYYFQQGFQRGYDDGYTSRFDNGTNENGSLNIHDSVLGLILNVDRY